MRIFISGEEKAAERKKLEEGTERGCEAQEEMGKRQLASDIGRCWQIYPEP